VNGHSGLNVVDVTGNINLSNASLTLTGPADAFFVVDVGGSITLGGSGGIKVGGSVPASQLLVNMTGNGASINTHVGNVVQGTLLGPLVGGSLDGAFGSLLLGENFSLLSGVTITFQGCPPADGTCRPATTCPSGTTMSPDGTCTPVTTCPSGTTMSPDGTCTPVISCPSGSEMSPAGTCVAVTVAGSTAASGQVAPPHKTKQTAKPKKMAKKKKRAKKRKNHISRKPVVRSGFTG
jgi:hypothetical protein